MRRRVAMITGGARGLGKMSALALAKDGYNIVINYLSSRLEAERLRSELIQEGVDCITVQADITKSEDIVRLMKEAVEQMGSIDILINNAGPFVRERKLFAEYTPHEIEYLLQANLTNVVMLDYYALPYMRTAGWGRIIHFGFAQAVQAPGWPHRAVYAAAKVGLVSFTKTLAVEEAASGITVNMVCPGDIVGDNKEKRIADVLLEYDEETPRGRPGTGEDISRTISFLCSDHSDFITGNIIDVSGGLDPIRPLKAIPQKPLQ